MATTVATPRKCPGSDRPSSLPLSSSTVTQVTAPCGYICSTVGANNRSTSSRSSNSQSGSKLRGYFAKSSLGPNWVGFTKMEAATIPQQALAARTRDRWPSWRAPMVGTNPRRSPWLRAARQAARISEIVVRILMLRRRTRLWGMNTAKRQPLQGRHSLGRNSDAERTRKGREATSMHHYWDICLECPDQRNDPSNHCPPDEDVQKHNRGRVALAAGEGNDRG